MKLYTLLIAFFFMAPLLGADQSKDSKANAFLQSAADTQQNPYKILSKEEIEANKKKEGVKDKESREKVKDKKKKEEEEAKKKKEKEDETPWFIGTLLATFSENVDPGKYLFETTLFASRVYGVYGSNSSLVQNRNAHIYSLLLSYEMGLTEVIDVAINIPGVYTHTRFGDRLNLGDIFLQFGFQIAEDKKKTWVPNLRIVAGEIFPTGKFENLNPGFGSLDATGLGSFSTSLGLIVGKTFYTNPCHPYNWNFNFFIIHSQQARVRGFNAFGGSSDTSGFVIPGERFIFNLAYEYKFNKNWGWGIDIRYTYQNSSSFRSKKGADLFVGDPSSYQFSLAPEIEYDFSYELGISMALWYTLAGRNNFAFFGGAFLFSYLF